VIEDRAGLRSTIVASQLPIANWHDAISEPTLADAALDRILANLHRIELDGESMRRKGAPPPDGDRPTAQPDPDEQLADTRSRR
jgi:DNA replication protein DnaC